MLNNVLNIYVTDTLAASAAESGAYPRKRVLERAIALFLRHLRKPPGVVRSCTMSLIAALQAACKPSVVQRRLLHRTSVRDLNTLRAAGHRAVRGQRSGRIDPFVEGCQRCYSP